MQLLAALDVLVLRHGGCGGGGGGGGREEADEELKARAP